MGLYQIVKCIIITVAIAIWPLFSMGAPMTTQASAALLAQHYKDGWILDNFQGMAHSESMGMGLLAATNVADRKAFDTLWQNTQKLQRPDNLFAWQYDLANKKITDYNNATDGEIYIAYALFKAASTFKEPKYRVEALKITHALPSLIVQTEHGPQLLPGQYGFNEGTPVINLSYYVYPAFLRFKAETADPVWDALITSGSALTEKALFGRYALPPDWLAAGAVLKPWTQRPPVFGYDAIRIPLYLAAIAPKHTVVAKYKAFSLLKKPTVDLSTDALAEYGAPPGMQAVSAYVRGGYLFKPSKDYYDIALQVMIESFG